MNVTDYMNFELVLFGRVDQHDRNRTHGDIREAFFELVFDEWTFGFGIHKDGSVLIAAEASCRFGENWKILLEGRGYIPQGENILQFFRNDSQIQIDIEYHY